MLNQVAETSGLVRSKKIGRTRTCAANPAALESAESWIAERRSLWERRLDRLSDFLADPDDSPDPGWAGNQPTMAINPRRIS
jgi:hypothetical protein